MELAQRITLCTTVWFIVMSCIQCDADEPTVTITTGTLKGSVHRTIDGRSFNAFRGIPYAKPPIGQLRFKPPEPAEPWTGILNATKDGSPCIQQTAIMNLSDLNVGGDENCLFINVYKPQTDKRMPVLLYVHGGAFCIGSGSMMKNNPETFMNMDIVLVIMNYRLGVLGFLSSEDENAPGNYGLLDQVMSLRWVQENIHSFGGDPNKVTIFGESAGAGSVALLFLSPLTKGLFHAAIAQSGSTQHYWSIQENPRVWANRIAEGVECPTKDSRQMVECLRKKPANDLESFAKSQMFAPLFPLSMLPVVEVPGGGGFLTEDPFVLLKEGRIPNKVPYITGVTKDEGFVFAYMTSRFFKTNGEEFFNEEFPTKYLPDMIPVKPPEQLRLKKISKLIQKEYFHTDEDLNNKSAFLERYSEVLSDVMFVVGTDATLKLLTNAGIETYAYKYTYCAKTIKTIFGISDDQHVNHADDAALQFQTRLSTMEHDTDDITMNKIFNHVWVNIAETGNPSFSQTPCEEQSPVWLPFDADKPNYLELCLNPVMKEGTLGNRTKFWTETVHRLANDDLSEKDEL